MSYKKSVFTIATGLPAFREMAINLALSFEYFNGDNDIPFYIITDYPLIINNALKKTYVVNISGFSLPRGFSIKLLIDNFAPSDKSIFVDADCLFTGPADPLFEAFDGLPVGIFGVTMTSGERFGDVESYLRVLSIEFMPNFNGGIYYVDKNAGAKKIFDEARKLEPLYDQVGFVRLRGQPNDEMLIGAALAKQQIKPVENTGRYYADFQWWPQVIKLDILKGICHMMNPPYPDSRHQDYFPASDATPIVVHFLGHHVEGLLYKRSSVALRLWFARIPAPSLLAVILTSHLCAFELFKNMFRGIYHAIFGARPIQKTKNRFILDNTNSSQPKN